MSNLLNQIRFQEIILAIEIKKKSLNYNVGLNLTPYIMEKAKSHKNLIAY